jgi:predicted amidophosphoribosyltransferase
VLVDDVFTTGATLAEAGAALRAAGAARVEAVTFARAEPPVSLA